MDGKITDLIVGMISDVSSRLNRIEEKVTSIQVNMVTKDECNGKCIQASEFEVKKEELSIKKIAQIGGIITASFAGLAGLVKLVFDAVQ